MFAQSQLIDTYLHFDNSFPLVLWTEKEVTNERTSTLEKNQSHRPIIISPIGDKPGKSIKSVL